MKRRVSGTVFLGTVPDPNIRDEGPGFDLNRVLDPTDMTNLERVSGRGLLLINTFMDEVKHNKTGNEITMVKRRHDSEG